MSFLSLGIRGRLYAGFTALVLFGLALAGFAVWQLSAIQGQADRMTVLSENATRVLQTSFHLESIRRAVLRYVFDANEPSFTEAAEREVAAIALLETTTKASSLSEERKKIYKGVEDSVVKLRAARETLGVDVKKLVAGKTALDIAGTELTANNSKLLEAARASGDDAAAAAAASLEPRVLMVRLQAWRFLATRDAKILDSFKSSVDKVKLEIAALEKAEMPASVHALIEPVKKSLTGYQAAFATTSESLVKSDALYIGTIRALSLESIDTLKTAETSLLRDLEATKVLTNGAISGTILTQEIVAGAAFLLGFAIAFFIARSIVGPLNHMTGAMGKLASGDLKVVVPGLGQTDEIGTMAKAVEVFRQSMTEAERLRAEQAETEKRGVTQRKAEMQKLADQFETAVGEIVATVSSASTELEASAITLTKTAENTQKLSIVVAAASEEASTNVQSVAAATEEMAASVTEIGRQVQESSRISTEAVGQAQTTDERMARLAQSASRIGDVTKLITTIAEQTNLLALNATIEAARAGESGRGFAVVAQEVKALASQTAHATSEISTQIAEMQSATQESVTAIKEIGATIGRISEIATTIASAVEEQGAATQEITRNVQQAAAGTTQVASNITEVNRGAAETGAASSEVLSSAQSLSSESNRLKLEMDKFLASVRAA